MSHFDIFIGMRYVIKIKPSHEFLCREKSVPPLFKGIATASTINAVMIDNKFWLPYSGITMSEDVYLTGDAFKEKDSFPQPPERVLDLWEHQNKTVAFIRANRGGLLYLGMGTGKTKCTVDICQNDATCKAILIICPKALPSTWHREFIKHAKNIDKFELLVRYPFSWTVEKRAQVLAERTKMALMRGKIPVIALNYDVMHRDEIQSFVMGVEWSHIVCDESQKMKSSEGAISKAMWKLGDAFEGKAMKLLLTGTPMPHSPSDIWSQFRFLNSKVFGQDFYRFQKRYCVKKKLGNKTYLDRFGRERPIEVISHYVNTVEMRKLIFQHAIKYDRDVITLPEAVHTIISVPLEPSAHALYEKLKKEMRAIIGTSDEYGDINEQGEITITNGLVKTIRLMQVTGGCVPDDDGNLKLVSTAKREAFAEVLDDIDIKEPLVVFCVSYHDMDNCKAVALDSGRTVGEYSGRIKQLEEWRDGKTDVLVVQIRAGGVGIDLTRACYNIMYSTGHGAGDYDQAICRSHRPGQMADHVNFIHLHCTGTIDGVIYKAIQEKRSIVEAIMHHIKTAKGEEDD